jgi:uncharacterized alkaline shock family protein YloU
VGSGSGSAARQHPGGLRRTSSFTAPRGARHACFSGCRTAAVGLDGSNDHSEEGEGHATEDPSGQPEPAPLGWAAVTDLAVPAVSSLLRPPRDRGALDIADRVVAKIAGRAAGEVAGVEVPNVGGLRDLVGTATPKVQADVDGHTAAVTVVVAIDYPLPVYDTAAEVRRRVTERLAELAGIDRVDVRIEIDELFVSRRSNAPRVV